MDHGHAVEMGLSEAIRNLAAMSGHWNIGKKGGVEPCHLTRFQFWRQPHVLSQNIFMFAFYHVIIKYSLIQKKMLAVGIIIHPYPADLGRPEFRTRALTRLWQERMPAPESWLFGSFWGTLKWMVHSGKSY